MKDFMNISTEKKRVYHFIINNAHVIVEIHNPVKLKVSDNGHRIVNDDGKCFYIPNTWVFFEFENKDPSTGFTF